MSEDENEVDGVDDLGVMKEAEYNELRTRFKSSIDLDLICDLMEKGNYDDIIEIHAEMRKLFRIFGDEWIDRTQKRMYDPKPQITSDSTSKTQISLIYRPDAVELWNFASCEDLAYSRDECKDFIKVLSDKVHDRVNALYLGVYSKRSVEGTDKGPIYETFKHLICAADEALTLCVCDSESRLGSKISRTVDRITATRGFPHVSIVEGDVPVCMIEIETQSTFQAAALESFEKPKSVQTAHFKRFNPLSKMDKEYSHETACDPIAQICCCMVNNGCRYGILSNWDCTYFLKLQMDLDGTMVLHYSDRFSPLTKESLEQGFVGARGNERLGDVVREITPGCNPASLAQATVLFIWLARRDLVVPPNDAGPEYFKLAMERRGKKLIDSALSLSTHMYGVGPSIKLKVEPDGTSQFESGPGDEVVENVLTFELSAASVVPVLFKHGFGCSETTITNLQTGQQISGCFAKSIMVNDTEMADLETYQSAISDFENEIYMYEGPARALQGTVIPSVVYVGKFDNGAGIHAVLVTRIAGHALSSTEGKRIAKAQGLLIVKDRVHAAIAALHSAGITHGDMGLRNVTIREDGGVSLIDLGRASCDPSGAPLDLEVFAMDFDATFRAELSSQQ
ncbi:Hormonally up-regulated neu tumor-associated kinase [Hondaea fermentalgiana]|uniref:Hormonally up-regulated neu tumor-associated kinase n=1 Tax=Hondaea fermentalgiana TaxID=2315210 RepID=A0A2R5G6K0_9STRA|nr:Hormonally up-regulated neu tumor-associated kinase [Hondaea fermentalgiana]|eukprot:GBG24063.1 Hormonally up-regulated neu tumor-associated kinase [Hondaea fermentalgiana]